MTSPDPNGREAPGPAGRPGSAPVLPVWNGWAPPASRPPLPKGAARMLVRHGFIRRGAPLDSGVAASEVALPGPRLTEAAAMALRAVVGPDQMHSGRGWRLAHAAGKSYLDLLRQRAGDVGAVPDAVVRPADHDEVRAVVDACVEHRVAVVPFGGGTSVVGGVAPLRGGRSAVISLDLTRLDRVHEIDHTSLTARLGAGMRGPLVEESLGREGLTLGHLPQSFEQSTVGGWVATRSAGQASSGHGRIDDLVQALTCVTPAGDLQLGRGPASAAGPGLLELLVGSEGTLGVITSATLAVRPLPEVSVYAGWSFPSFPHGLAALRALAQRLGPGLMPDVCRLSDPDETQVTLTLAGSSAATLALRGYLRARGHRAGCLAVFGWEGDRDLVALRRHRAARLFGAQRGVSLGRAPGQAWLRSRFSAPYLRDTLLDHGVLVETLETAADWIRLPGVYAAVRSALARTLASPGPAPVVQCHVSHVYRTGASLYVTVVGAQDRDDPIGQWQQAKAAATDAILASGGTLTHHHAVGVDHAPWMPREVGDTGLAVLRAAKSALDPTGVLNPGKLLP